MPQYLSYVFTGKQVTEYTSLGCHTSLWNIERADYHDWVCQEGIDSLFPERVPTDQFISTSIYGKKMRVGPGIHDSSASLLPYYFGYNKKFILLSTGTWSIALNPFFGKESKIEIGAESLNYLTIKGTPILATRFFLGNEYKKQVKALNGYYSKDESYHKTVTFNPNLLPILNAKDRYFKFEDIVIKRKRVPKTRLDQFVDFEHAYHQLIFEFVQLQVKTIKLADSKEGIKRLFLDGGFSNNTIFVQLLMLALDNKSIRVTHNPYGAALGACIVGNPEKVGDKFLKKHYKPLKPEPIVALANNDESLQQ